MKKSYLKLNVYLLFFSLFFLFNTFVYKFLNQISIIVILLVMLVILKYLLGFEKDRHRYIKDVILEIIINLIVFFIIYYLMGIFTSYARTNNYYTLRNIFKFIVPVIIYVFLKEFLRYQVLCKASENKFLIVLAIVMFVIMDNTIIFSSHSLAFNKEVFLLIAIYLLPSISSNILCSYLSENYGYKPSICYMLIMNLYSYLFGVIPNPNEYIYSVIFFLLPFIVLKRIKVWSLKDRVLFKLGSSRNKKERQLLYYLPLCLITGILVYFVSGYFRYYAVGIASGSMETVISIGDVVIVDKEYGDLEVNDILAYKYENKIIVHRVYKIYDNNNEYYIYTKGDANALYDKYKITKDMIIGVVKYKIPMIGYPTVLLNEIW